MTGEWERYEPDEAAAPSPYSRTGKFDAYDPEGDKRRLRRSVVALVAIVAVGAGAAGVGSWFAVRSAADEPAQGEIAEAPLRVVNPPAPDFDAFTNATTSAMIAALKERTGSTQVLEVTFFKEQIIIKVPGPTEDGPAHMYTWNGELDLYGETDVYRHPFDVSPLRGAAVGRLCGPDRERCVAEVHRPYESEGNAWMEVTDTEAMRTQKADLAGRVVG